MESFINALFTSTSIVSLLFLTFVLSVLCCVKGRKQTIHNNMSDLAETPTDERNVPGTPDSTQLDAYISTSNDSSLSHGPRTPDFTRLGDDLFGGKTLPFQVTYPSLVSLVSVTTLDDQVSIDSISLSEAFFQTERLGEKYQDDPPEDEEGDVVMDTQL